MQFFKLSQKGEGRKQKQGEEKGGEKGKSAFFLNLVQYSM